MPNVYLVNADGRTESFAQVHCEDESEELQRVLEMNLDLLPGDQIRPDDPRRWLLVKREMPVQDPGSGGARWSVDLFLLDQDGIPTFVECKRYKDTRSRREVVGQMLEYAANGQFYWTKESMRDLAAATASDKKEDLEETVMLLEPTTGDSADDLFEAAENNLREGQVRLVFFLEEAPAELKSIVDFLNRQMERTEVLLVEARQYEKDGTRVLVPSLFGYTEQARRVKRQVSVTSGGRGKWDEASFFDDAEAKLSQPNLVAVREIYDKALQLGYHVKWGTGRIDGSFSLVLPRACPRSVITVDAKGKLTLNFPWLRESDSADLLKVRFIELVKRDLELPLTTKSFEKYTKFDIKEWQLTVDQLVRILTELSKEFG